MECNRVILRSNRFLILVGPIRLDARVPFSTANTGNVVFVWATDGPETRSVADTRLGNTQGAVSCETVAAGPGPAENKRGLSLPRGSVTRAPSRKCRMYRIGLRYWLSGFGAGPEVELLGLLELLRIVGGVTR